MSKRRLLKLVMEKYVNGWDDPRLPTLNGLRRRGYTPEAINDFCNTIGVSRSENMIPMQVLEFSVRNRLEEEARRAMVIQKPLKIVITNYGADKTETLKAPNFPKDESKSFHDIIFSRIVYIDSDDFKEKDEKDFFGLAPGKEVHLKYAYNITAQKIVKGNDGNIDHIEATIDLTNKNKPKGKIHWVAEPKPGQKPLTVELRLYDSLFKSANPMALDEWLTDLNPNSLVVVKTALADPSLASVKPGDKFQFERLAFFVCDPDSKPNSLVFNRTVSLKESKTKAIVTGKQSVPFKPRKEKSAKEE